MSEQHKYDNTNKIAIFVNNRDGRAENAPMLTGRVNVEGVDYRISLWAQKSNKDGSTFWAGKIQKDEPREQTNNGTLPPGGSICTSATAAHGNSANADLSGSDDDIPF